MSSLTINKSKIYTPSALVLFYLAGLSFSVFFVTSVGESTLIDELMLLVMLPIAVIGLFRKFFETGLPAKLILLYFSFTILSSIVALATREDIPFIAPFIGIALDTKFIVFLGAFLYLGARSTKSGSDIILDICKAIIIIGVLNSLFFLRDIFSSGTSLSGIGLRASNIFGYIPIGLLSHKVDVAVIASLSFIASITLYLYNKKTIHILLSLFFLLILFFAASMKELVVLVVFFFIILRASNNKKNEISSSSKRLIFVAMFLTPIMGFMLGSVLEDLIRNRINVYIFEENARAAMHIKSLEIATDYFPVGSGAGTFSSQPSRTIYYSPLYYEYGMNNYYGASEDYSSFLMDVGWPKFIAEAGWIGGGAYFFAYLSAMVGLILSFIRYPRAANTFGLMVGALIFSSALGSAVFTGSMGLMLCALYFFCAYLDRNNRF